MENEADRGGSEPLWTWQKWGLVFPDNEESGEDRKGNPTGGLRGSKEGPGLLTLRLSGPLEGKLAGSPEAWRVVKIEGVVCEHTTLNALDLGS